MLNNEEVEHAIELLAGASVATMEMVGHPFSRFTLSLHTKPEYDPKAALNNSGSEIPAPARHPTASAGAAAARSRE
jgi:hypothetical protein